MSDDGHDRLRRLSGVVAAARGAEPARAVCRASVDALSVSGAGLTVMHDDVLTPLGWSNAVALGLEDLQQVLGEGPSRDAHRTGRSVSEPDLARPGRTRWVALGPAALAAGVAALFSFPLRVGAVRLGALTLHQTTAGALSAQQHGDAQTVAEVAAGAILMTQAGAPNGSLSHDLETLVAYSAPLHQASGMVSVQLGIGVGEALVRLRAYAFTENRQLGDVAADVVARRLRLGE